MEKSGPAKDPNKDPKAPKAKAAGKKNKQSVKKENRNNEDPALTSVIGKGETPDLDGEEPEKPLLASAASTCSQGSESERKATTEVDPQDVTRLSGRATRREGRQHGPTISGDEYRNDNFQVNLKKLLLIFGVNLCSPFGFLVVCLIVTIDACNIWRRLSVMKVSRSTQRGHDDGRVHHIRAELTRAHGYRKVWWGVLKRNYYYLVHQAAEHSSSTIVSSMLNVSLLISYVSGHFNNMSPEYLMEALLPRWLMIGVLLSEATQYVMKSPDDLDNFDSAAEIRDAVAKLLKIHRPKLPLPSEETGDPHVCFAIKSPTCFSYTFIQDEPKGDGFALYDDAIPEIVEVICPKWARSTPLRVPVRMWQEWKVLNGVNHLSKMAKDARRSTKGGVNASSISQSKPEDERSVSDTANAPQKLSEQKANQMLFIHHLNEAVVDMARLQLALGDIAHETLLRHIVRIFDSTIKLPFQKPSFQLKSGSESDKTEQEESEQEASGELKFDKHSGTIYPTDTEEADRDSFSDQLTTTEHKMSFAYKQALEEGWMPVHVLADQLLLGGVVPANSFYYVKATCKCIANAFGVALIAYAAILPAVAGTTFGGIVRTSFILFVFTNGSMMSLWYPTQLRKLFSQMSESVRMFNVMLMGRKAAGADFLPHIRVGNIDDIAGWYLLYSFFIASFQRRKLALELGFGHGVLTVVVMSVLVLVLLYTGDTIEKPRTVVFLCETFTFLLAFAMFSVQPLLVGLRANLLNRRTVDLLWGHATESRAYLCKLEKVLANLAEEQKVESEQDTQEELKRKIKDAAAAAELTESIAQRTRLDTTLVVRTLGMELTLAQFTAIASICSTAAIYAYNKLKEKEDQVNSVFVTAVWLMQAMWSTLFGFTKQ